MGEIFRVGSDHGQALQDIVKELNRLNGLVAQAPKSKREEYSGSPSGTQVVEKADGTVAFQVKTKAGWHEVIATKVE